MSQTESKTDCKEMTFSSDEFALKGTLHFPRDIPYPPVIIGSHGLLSDSNSPKQIALAEACCNRGIAYFRFDHRGCGKSEGVFREVTSLESRCRDLASAINMIRETDNLANWIGLFGSSVGGAASLAIAKQFSVDTLVTFAAPISSASIIKSVEDAEDDTANTIGSSVDLDLLQFDISKEIAGIQNILIFHGDSDKTVSPSEAHKLYQSAVFPKRLIMQKNGDHRMSLKENQEKFIRETVAWYKNAVKENPPEKVGFKA